MCRRTVAAAAIAPFLQDNESLPINGRPGQITFPDFDMIKDKHAERDIRLARVGQIARRSEEPTKYDGRPLQPIEHGSSLQILTLPFRRRLNAVGGLK